MKTKQIAAEPADIAILLAAPDLLAALKAVKALALPGATHIHRVCDDAISKAEGKEAA